MKTANSRVALADQLGTLAHEQKHKHDDGTKTPTSTRLAPAAAKLTQLNQSISILIDFNLFNSAEHYYTS
jgi:hypothetical protein